MFRPGPLEIVLIVVALLLLFGARRIPDIARSLGQAMREFRKGLRDGTDDHDDHGGTDGGHGGDGGGGR